MMMVRRQDQIEKPAAEFLLTTAIPSSPGNHLFALRHPAWRLVPTSTLLTSLDLIECERVQIFH
jgi:hypothetical protein